MKLDIKTVQLLHYGWRITCLAIPTGTLLLSVWGIITGWWIALWLPLAVSAAVIGLLQQSFAYANPENITIIREGTEGYFGFFGPYPVIDARSGNHPGPCIVHGLDWAHAEQGGVGDFDIFYTFHPTGYRR